MISSTTVIAARGFSSMLTQAVGGDCAGAHCVGDELFPPCRLTLAHYLFWLLLAIIVTTAIWSAYFLNRAMMIFGNTEVVPVYYCTFTLASIVGGGVERETRRVPQHMPAAPPHTPPAESAL